MLDRAEIIGRYRVPGRSVPRLRLNFVASVDGAATRNGVSGVLGNADDRFVFDSLRMLTDVIVVGAGTVRAEGYGGIRVPPADAAWRLANGLPAQPPLAIVSSRLDLEPTHPAFTNAPTRPLVVTHAGSPLKRRAALAEVADVLVCGRESVDLALMVARLAERGYPQLLCEGGPRLFGALIEADCVDELCLTISPVLEGGPAGRIAHGNAPATREMTLLHVLTAGDTIFLRYERPAKVR